MHNSEIIAQIVIMPIFFGVLGWIFKLYWDWKKIREKSSIYNRLMERFNNIEDLNHFLQTEGGNQFLKSLNINGGSMKYRFIADISRAIMAIFPGAAIITLGWIYPHESREFFSFGIIVLSVGF